MHKTIFCFLVEPKTLVALLVVATAKVSATGLIAWRTTTTTKRQI